MKRKKTIKINKIFLAVIAVALAIGGAIYFGFQEFAQIENQLASLQEQVTLLLEEPTEITISELATSTSASGELAPAAPKEGESSSTPSVLESVNPCDLLNCDKQDGWVNSGSTFTCQDENAKTCTCQKQIYHDYSCSSQNQKCVYSTTNTRTSKYNCLALYPDLIVQPVSFSPVPPIAGDNMTFSATIKNQGRKSADSFLSYLTIDGVRIAEFSTASLVINESIVFTKETAWSAIAGQHELEVCADGVKMVAESSEVNNCTKITFTVSSAALPDLVVESMDFSPDPLTAGQIVSFAGTIKNQGRALSKPTLTVLRLDLGNNGDWNEFPGAKSTEIIAIGTSIDKIWRDVWVSFTGTHKVEICADAISEPELRMAESNEINNCLSKVFVVP